MRKCTICNKRLSDYNTQDICFCHQAEEQFKYIPVTCCTSSIQNGLDEYELVESFKPGAYGYNAAAYTRVSLGHFASNKKISNIVS